MMKLPVYTTEKKETGEMSVPARVFGASWNADLVHQAVVTHEANARNIVAHAKTRAEVRGGGKKPWKQKGTGRSRHGSIRSPLWIGGGVTHGPLKDKVYAKKINKKMKLAALYAVLSYKVREGALYVVEAMPVTETTTKTKAVVPVVRNFFGRGSGLIVAASGRASVRTATRNIPRVMAVSAVSLNAYDAMKAKTIVFEKQAIEELITRINKEKKEVSEQ